MNALRISKIDSHSEKRTVSRNWKLLRRFQGHLARMKSPFMYLKYQKGHPRNYLVALKRSLETGNLWLRSEASGLGEQSIMRNMATVAATMALRLLKPLREHLVFPAEGPL